MTDEMIRKTIEGLAEIHTKVSLKFSNCKTESEKIDKQFSAFVNYVREIHGTDELKFREYENLYEKSKALDTKL